MCSQCWNCDILFIDLFIFFIFFIFLLFCLVFFYFHSVSFISFVVLCNFQCRAVLQIWMTEGQGPAVLAGACGACLDIFSPGYHLSFLFLSLSLSLSERRLDID